MDESVYDNLDDEFDELQRLQNETLDSTDRTNDTSQDDVDRRSVYVGNVCELSLRLNTQLRLRIYRNTSSHAVKSIASPLWLTSGLGTPKGRNMTFN